VYVRGVKKTLTIAGAVVVFLAGATCARTISASAADTPRAHTDGVVGVGNHSARIYGENRYATSVAVVQTEYAENPAPVVYLASGEDYPDALGLAGLKLRGPLLLTKPNELPAIVRDEIAELHPCSIAIIGGPHAVSDAVALQADAFTDETSCGKD